LPVTGFANLVVEYPVRCFADRRVIGGETRVEQSLDRPYCVPHWRHARLEEHVPTSLHKKVFDRLDTFCDCWMVMWIAKAVQRHDRVEHGWLNTTPTTVDVLVIQHPPLGFAQRLLSQRFHRASPQKL
jgi:hypothetical protein